MKYSDFTFNKDVTLTGYFTGIIRRVDGDGRIYPPEMIMAGAGLTAWREFVTIRLANGGIALIPLDAEEPENSE